MGVFSETYRWKRVAVTFILHLTAIAFVAGSHLGQDAHSQVYRVGAYRAATGTPHGYALRLLVEPTRSAPAVIQAVAN